MRFSQKVFITMLILMALAMHLVTICVYLSAYTTALSSEQARSEREQYAAVLGIVGASNIYELGARLSGFMDAYLSNGAQLELMSIEAYGPRTIEHIDDGRGRALVVTSGLPAPFGGYALRYRRSLLDVEAAQRQLLYRLVAIELIALAAFAALAFICLHGLTRPLKRLSDNMRRFEKGEKPVLYAVTGGDEVSKLTRRFYAMTRSIRRKNRALEAENGRRKRFIDDLSHELRTPTTSIGGYAALLRDARLTEKQREEALDFLVRESGRINDMADKLMSLTGLSAEPPRAERLDGRELVQSVRASIAPILDASGVAIHYEVGQVSLVGERELLQSLMINLLQNALRASKPGDEVALSLKGEPPVLLIEDHGIGMTREQLKHALEPFYTADKARSRSQGGVGLGLSICAAIVQIHGAELTMASEPGAGTRVRVQFTNQIQPGEDMDARSAVSSLQGPEPEEEEREMKSASKKRRSPAPLFAVALLLVFGILGAPALFEWLPAIAFSVEERPMAEGEALVPLPQADMRFDSLTVSREVTDEENDRHMELVTAFLAAFEGQRGEEAEGDYAEALIEYMQAQEIEAISDRPVDGIYVKYSDMAVELILPDRPMTDYEILQFYRFYCEVWDPADTAIYRVQGADGEGRPYTERERERKEELKARYEQEGLRPQNPIPTSPTEDGFYHDPAIDAFHVALTRTYELTDEQLLQIIDLEYRASQSLYDAYIAPVKALHTDEEWAAIAESLFAENGLSIERQERAYWDVRLSLGWDVSGSPTAFISYGLEEDQWSSSRCAAVIFDPMNDNRVESISLPTQRKFDVGASLLTTAISDEQWREIMNRREWRDIAEAYAKTYVFKQGAALKSRINEEIDREPYDSAWDEDHIVTHEAVYMQVFVEDESGKEICVDINPDTRQVNGYRWVEDRG